MRILLGSPLLWAYPFDEILPLAHSLGYGGVEVWAQHVRRTGERPQAIARLSRRLGLALTVHAMNWDINTTSSLREIREASQRLTTWCVDLAARLEAPLVVVHPGRMTVPADRPDAYWQLQLDFLRRLAAYAHGRQVTIGLEHMERIRNEFLVTPEDMHHALDALAGTGIVPVFDTAHIPWGEDLIAAYQRMPPVGHVHLSDATEDAYHLPVGQGGRDLAGFLSYLLKSGYQGFVTIEGIEHRKVPDTAATNMAAMSALVEALAKTEVMHGSGNPSHDCPANRMTHDPRGSATSRIGGKT
jgi:sugar phosphate isomerase/epimerase